MFFEEGKPSFIARVDKEGCLFKITQPSKLALQEIRQKFSTIVRERRKENTVLTFSSNNPNSLANKIISSEPASPDATMSPFTI